MSNVTPVTTTRAAASQIILAAVAAENLPAQNDHGGTYYEELSEDKIVRCAIGQLYPIEDARRLQRASTDYYMANGLISEQLLIVPEAEASWFEEVQAAHDDWATAVLGRDFDRPEDLVAVTDAREKFLGLLQPAA